MRFYGLQTGVLIAALGSGAAQSVEFTEPPPEHPAIGYHVRPIHDPVGKLNARILSGEIQLTFEEPGGYLRSVLAALSIPLESQMAVFAKTSLQAQIIGPNNPRTIYFGDSVAIAWVPGEPFVEAASHDPQQGVIFFTLNQQPASRPQFIRADYCLSCHISHASLGVPGMMVRSVFPSMSGRPERPLGDYISDHRSALAERWGGWYVTGNTGSLQHMGNTVYTDPATPAKRIYLKPKLTPDAYLTPYSDVVALMVFEHQMRFMNLLTLYGWQIRAAAQDRRAFDIDSSAREIVDYMLFVDEAPLEGEIRGTSGFTEAFAASGIRDTQGRSLKDLDLKHRLMRYPCSYMIYSEAFDGLPEEGRTAIYKRMWEILSQKNEERKYAKLSASDRRAVLEILHDTKKGLPGYFQESSAKR
jgi:hypothetical protein